MEAHCPPMENNALILTNIQDLYRLKSENFILFLSIYCFLRWVIYPSSGITVITSGKSVTYVQKLHITHLLVLCQNVTVQRVAHTGRNYKWILSRL